MTGWAVNLLTTLLSAGLLALAGWSLPVPRWTRQIKSDQSIARDLPEGSAKDWYATRALRNAERVRDYTEAATGLDRALRWACVVWTAGWPIVFLLVGWDRVIAAGDSFIGPGWWFLALAYFYIGLAGTIQTFRGHDIRGRTPAQARAHREEVRSAREGNPAE